MLGEFTESSEDLLIPLSLIQKAGLREHKPYGEILIGVDVARYGSDESVILLRDFNGVIDLRAYQKRDLMFLVGKVLEKRRE